MALSFSCVKTKFAKKNPLIEKLQGLMEKQPYAYKYIARIFTANRTNPAGEHDRVLEIIKMTIHHPVSELSAEERESLISVMDEIYSCSESDFLHIRSDFLEYVIYVRDKSFIPNAVAATIHMEPTVREGNLNIGQYNKQCDFVWHWSDVTPMYFCECKANIHNTINVRKGLNGQGKKKYKILYMKNCYEYLKENYAAPHMILAFYNEDYGEVENTLKSWGMSFFEFMGPRELLKHLTTDRPIGRETIMPIEKSAGTDA